MEEPVLESGETVKISDPELFLSERTAGTKMEKRLKERQSNDGPSLGSTLLCVRGGEHDTEA